MIIEEACPPEPCIYGCGVETTRGIKGLAQVGGRVGAFRIPVCLSCMSLVVGGLPEGGVIEREMRRQLLAPQGEQL